MIRHYGIAHCTDNIDDIYGSGVPIKGNYIPNSYAVMIADTDLKDQFVKYAEDDLREYWPIEEHVSDDMSGTIVRFNPQTRTLQEYKDFLGSQS